MSDTELQFRCSYSGLPLTERRSFEPGLDDMTPEQAARRSKFSYLDANCTVAALMKRRPRGWKEKVAALEDDCGASIEPATLATALTGGYQKRVSMTFSEPLSDFVARAKSANAAKKRKATSAARQLEPEPLVDRADRGLNAPKPPGSAAFKKARTESQKADEARAAEVGVTTNALAAPLPPASVALSTAQPLRRYRVVVDDSSRDVRSEVFLTDDWVSLLAEQGYRVRNGGFKPVCYRSTDEWVVYPGAEADAKYIKGLGLCVTVQQLSTR